MSREVALVPYAREAVTFMAGNVHQARINRRWTAAQLGAHAGCSEYTVRMIERGVPSVAFGNVMNVCAALGITLFVPDQAELARLAAAQAEVIRLMPNRVMPRKAPTSEF